METEEYKNIKSISFPNNQTDPREINSFTEEGGYSFKLITENGEMAQISWIAVFKDGKKVAQIKQSVCNIYFK